MNHFVCIHNHFYQPPRENPWLEEVEYQESAYPFHDWNERITSECYRPNAESRILEESQVVDVMNNYSKINFNFGPTLLSWMEKHDPDTYRKILEGDQQSVQQFSGHGSAIAQAYNHLILPLAHPRDRITQIEWGLADFRSRFHREPESMWLPETAVDTETLELLAAYGFKYVILAPRQAHSCRVLDDTADWHLIENEQFDVRVPYLIRLPSGKSIAAFFYHGEISRSVAFEGLLHNGEVFSNRLIDALDENSPAPQLVHIATDGETYGHHHRHGEMALSYLLKRFDSSDTIRLTNYSEYLEKFPPQHEARIHENSSWSCVHGIERWQEDCGCNTGGRPEWNQKWRKPLREAFDLIRDQINPVFEMEAAKFFSDPWEARNRYINVILNRDDSNIGAYLQENAKRILTPDEITHVLRLMEIQRHLLLMYTSCAWFFDELSGIEGVQNIQYAYRAIELAEISLQLDLEHDFVDALAKAPSNLRELSNGAIVFEEYVKPARVDLLQLGAHFAVSSLFEKFAQDNTIYCFEVFLEDFQSHTSGRATLNWGYGWIRSKITRKRWRMMFGVMHFGDHNINAGITEFSSLEDYQRFSEDLRNTFNRADFTQVIRILDQWLGEIHYTLKDLFRNEQRKVTQSLLSGSIDQIRSHFNELYDSNYPLICYLANMNIGVPRVYAQIATFVQNDEIQSALHRADTELNLEHVKKFLAEAKNWNLKLDEAGISRKFEEILNQKIECLHVGGALVPTLQNLVDLIKFAKNLPFKFDFASTQTDFFIWQHSFDQSSCDPEIQGLIQTLGNELNLRIQT